MIPRQPIIEIECIGGRLDGGYSPWAGDSPPEEGDEMTSRPMSGQLELRALYRYRDGAWRYQRSWRESEE